MAEAVRRAVAVRGVQFAVCDTASHGIARMLAGSGDADASYKEMVANLNTGARLVPAGVDLALRTALKSAKCFDIYLLCRQPGGPAR